MAKFKFLKLNKKWDFCITWDWDWKFIRLAERTGKNKNIGFYKDRNKRWKTVGLLPIR